MEHNNKKYVFTDIFDTLLSRSVQPEYVKKMWCNSIIKFYDLDISALDLYKKRYEIEIDLGNISLSEGNDCEIKYKDIIKKIFEFLKLNIQFEDFLSVSFDTELSIEKKVLYKNDDVIEMLKIFKKDGSRLYCISDMYFSKDMISELLKYNGILDLFEDVFVSCEYLKNKSSGKLYDFVLDKLKALPSDCLMIGDNSEKDYNIPKSKGIDAILIDRKKQFEKYEEFLLEHNPDKVVDKVFDIANSNNKGFNNIIFSLYTYVEKIYFLLKRKGFKEVFFLSREGEYLKKLFDYYVSCVGDDIKSHYIYVSRKATYLPSLSDIEKEDFSFLLDQYSYVSVREFLGSLNFTDVEIKLIEKDLKDIFTFDYKIPNFKQSIEFKVLKKSSVFRKIYEDNRSLQKDLFVKYISQKTSNRKIMVVDIGWNGSIQDNIQNILGDKYDVYGCYLGLVLRNKKYAGKKYGLVFSNDPYENKQFPLFYENRTIFEIMCGASHGSANKYFKNKNGIVDVSLFSKKEEQDIYVNIVKPAQDFMFDTFKRICNLLIDSYYDNIDVNKCFNKIHFDLLYNPSLDQLQFFDKLYHYENFGVFEFTTFNNVNKVGIKKWIKEHIKFFVRYRTYFDDCFWPILKLYNNRMKIPYLIYKTRRYKRYKKNNVI